MSCLKRVNQGVEITLKVVPGSSRDRIVGLLGDALKVQVSAPPEKGRANAAVAALLAEALGVSAKTVSVIRGASVSRKTVLVRGCSVEHVKSALGLG